MQVASPALEHLVMTEAPKITEIRDKQPLLEPKKEVESLCKLVSIQIGECNQLLYVFPSHMLPQNLEKLLIEKRDVLEVIFSKEVKEKEVINNDIIVFPQLESLTLWTLPKLKSFYSETQGFFSHKVRRSLPFNFYMLRIVVLVYQMEWKVQRTLCAQILEFRRIKGDRSG